MHKAPNFLVQRKSTINSTFSFAFKNFNNSNSNLCVLFIAFTVLETSRISVLQLEIVFHAFPRMKRTHTDSSYFKGILINFEVQNLYIKFKILLNFAIFYLGQPSAVIRALSFDVRLIKLNDNDHFSSLFYWGSLISPKVNLQRMEMEIYR